MHQLSETGSHQLVKVAVWHLHNRGGVCYWARLLRDRLVTLFELIIDLLEYKSINCLEHRFGMQFLHLVRVKFHASLSSFTWDRSSCLVSSFKNSNQVLLKEKGIADFRVYSLVYKGHFWLWNVVVARMVSTSWMTRVIMFLIVFSFGCFVSNLELFSLRSVHQR